MNLNKTISIFVYLVEHPRCEDSFHGPDWPFGMGNYIVRRFKVGPLMRLSELPHGPHNFDYNDLTANGDGCSGFLT
jgi:hypothetical protein